MSCCQNKAGKKIEKLQLPPLVYDVAANLVTTLCDLVNAGIKTLPDTLTVTELMAVLQSLVQKNDELQRKVDERKSPAVTTVGAAVNVAFGPNNAYVLSMPVTPAACDELAEQFDAIAQRLRQAARSNMFDCEHHQILFPFVDCA
jgi:hypothetical protein